MISSKRQTVAEKILEYLRQHPEGADDDEIAAALERRRQHVYSECSKLFRKGLIERKRVGRKLRNFLIGATKRKFLLVNGPNLNLLGKRDPAIYGSQTLAEINRELQKRAGELGVEVETFQSNHEGAIIDFLQAQAPGAQGIIINPGALTHYAYSLRDALVDTGLPFIEVHLSNIHAREGWRGHSVIAPVARGQVCGLRWQGYLAALEFLVGEGK